ncbi:PH domain-containing protein [Nocardia camponoti]|uniref:PH domain-containing protein n=1 Tax=Nocardia camponoti TaxID=1616106 RepID=UPI001663017A
MPVERIRRRGPAEPASEWELIVRPRKAIRTSVIIAVVILAFFTVGGILLRTGSTGVNFRLADQVAMIMIGVLGAAAVLLFTRPRLRAGAHGVSVRNILGDRDVPWSYVRGVSFADRKAWARLELTDDEYIPVLAIRANDKARAAAALEQLRALGARYAPAEPESTPKPERAPDTEN